MKRYALAYRLGLTPWERYGPAAAANRKGVAGATFVVGDVTDLASADVGTFDLFFDVGCFQCNPQTPRGWGGR
jgi:hypothetical protein